MEGAIEYSIDSLKQSPLNPRLAMDPDKLAELAQSIHQHGIIEPLVIRNARGLGGWEVIAGGRRLEAAQMAGLRKVPVVIHRNLSDRDALEMILIENCQREDLNPIERAQTYKRLMDEFDMTQIELSARTGIPAPTISDCVRLLNLPPEAQADVAEGAIGTVVGRYLARVADQPEIFEELHQQAKNGTNATVIMSRAKAHARGRNSQRDNSKDTVQHALNDLQLAIEQAREAKWEPVCRESLKTCTDIELLHEIAAYIRIKAGLPKKPERRYVPARWREGAALVMRDRMLPKDAAAKMGVSDTCIRFWVKRVLEASE